MSTISPPVSPSSSGPSTRWSVRAPPIAPATTGAHVGDLFLRERNGSLFLNLLPGTSFALFPEAPDRQKEAADLGLTTYTVKSQWKDPTTQKANWRTVGQFYLDLTAGDGTGHIPTFGAHAFTVKRQSTKATSTEK